MMRSLQRKTRTRLLIAAACLCAATTWAFTQTLEWSMQQVLPETVRMHALAMRSDVAGIAVGDSGVLRRAQFYTVDAELRRLLWSTERLSTNVTLHDVALLGGSGFVLVGEGGLIMRASSDQSLPLACASGTSSDLLGVAAHANLVIACGKGGTILRSSDGGATFSPVVVPTEDDVVDVCVDGMGMWTAITRNTTMRSSDGLQWWISGTDNIVAQHRIMAFQRPVYNDWILFRLGDPWIYEASTDAGATWVSVFTDGAAMKAAHPNARALSMSVSANGLQHSIMFVDESDDADRPFHFVSFNGGVSWADLCTLFFSEFVGTAQAMSSDTTLLSTGVGGTMLTFNRLGFGMQTRWSAPESVPFLFEPGMSTVGVGGVILADKNAVLDVSMEHDEARFTFYDQLYDVRALGSRGTMDLMLADTNWYEGVGLEAKQFFRTTMFAREDGADGWTKMAQHRDNVGARTLSTTENQTLVIPTGKTTMWLGALGDPPRFETYADTSWWNTSRGVLIGTDTAWVQVLTLDNIQQPLGIVTTDGGRSWEQVDNPPFYASGVFRLSSGTLVISGYEIVSALEIRVKVARSTDLGRTWTTTHDQIAKTDGFNEVPMLVSGDHIVLIGPSQVWLSTNSGVTFDQVQGIPRADLGTFTCGTWTSDSVLTIYTRGGWALRTTVPSLPTSVHEPSRTQWIHVSGQELSLDPTRMITTVSVDAIDVRGRTTRVVEPPFTQDRIRLDALTAGLWYIRVKGVVDGVPAMEVLPMVVSP